jgi:flagellar hook assembly protein FlgD
VLFKHNGGATDAVIAPEGRARLQQNQPNPFNPTTTIAFELARSGAVRCDVYDVHGRHVATLLDGSAPAGLHRVSWNGKTDRGISMPSGVYQYQLQAEGWAISRKMVLAR